MVEEQFQRSKKQGALEFAVLVGVIVLATVVGTALANRDLRRGGRLPKEKRA